MKVDIITFVKKKKKTLITMPRNSRYSLHISLMSE